jgi:hypothetical protein
MRQGTSRKMPRRSCDENASFDRGRIYEEPFKTPDRSYRRFPCSHSGKPNRAALLDV